MILTGDALAILATLPDASVQCCVTSPPYWGLRDYGVDGQLGLERTPDEYVAKMVAVFREVRRVLRDDGTLWLNLGDSYAANRSYQVTPTKWASLPQTQGGSSVPDGMKPKDLVGIPWRVAFALQADGWYLRSDIIWHKPNPMPESVRDRPTKAHEYVFLLSKRGRYYYDADAIAEESIHAGRVVEYDGTQKNCRAGDAVNDRRTLIDRTVTVLPTRNARSVWSITTKPFREAHFAVMPLDLAQRCVKAGSKPGDTILDPFGGAGTTGLAAVGLGRDAILIELNPDYAKMAKRRIGTPLLSPPHPQPHDS